jgi:hypothetical protein
MRVCFAHVEHDSALLIHKCAASISLLVQTWCIAELHWKLKDRVLPKFRAEALRMEVEQLYLLASRVASHVQKGNAKDYSRTVRLWSLASRAASQLQKCNAKRYSLTVKLYPLASRELSNAEY